MHKEWTVAAENLKSLGCFAFDLRKVLSYEATEYIQDLRIMRRKKLVRICLCY